MGKLWVLWYLFVGLMFIGSRIWGNAQDTIFWGVLFLSAQLVSLENEL